MTKTFAFSTVSPNIMSGRTNFNRTRNNTIHPSALGTNVSNSSDFGLNTSNNSRSDRDPFDESEEVMFRLLATLTIPSILCFVFLFYNFIRLPQLRTKSTNLFIICLLIINFVHVSCLFSLTWVIESLRKEWRSFLSFLIKLWV